jgi:hypothetical protein
MASWLPAVGVRHDSAGLADEEGSGRHVVRQEVELPIEASVGDVGEVDRGGANAPLSTLAAIAAKSRASK